MDVADLLARKNEEIVDLVQDLTQVRTLARTAVAEYDSWLYSETNRRVTDQPNSAHYALMQLLDTLDTKGR